MAALLRVLARLVARDVSTLNSIQGNNFVIFLLLLCLQPAAVGFFAFLVAVLFLFPLLSSPLDKIPPDRLALWPLSPMAQRLLRLFTLRPSFRIAAVRFPSPRLLPFLEKDLRQLFLSFDTWLAILLSASGAAYRFLWPNPEPMAFPVLACLVVLALSTQSQTLFGLDGDGGLVRYHLYPLPTWRILAYKGAAFLLVAAVLTAPLAPVSGLSAAFTTLAIGHYPSLQAVTPQLRWRFAQGQISPWGIAQAIGVFLVGMPASRTSPLFLAAAAVLYAASLFLTPKFR